MYAKYKRECTPEAHTCNFVPLICNHNMKVVNTKKEKRRAKRLAIDGHQLVDVNWGDNQFNPSITPINIPLCEIDHECCCDDDVVWQFH